MLPSSVLFRATAGWSCQPSAAPKMHAVGRKPSNSQDGAESPGRYAPPSPSSPRSYQSCGGLGAAGPFDSWPVSSAPATPRNHAVPHSPRTAQAVPPRAQATPNAWSHGPGTPRSRGAIPAYAPVLRPVARAAQAGVSGVAAPAAAAHPVPRPQASQPATQAMETLIILDWDDTLMCSTAISTSSVSSAVIPALELLVDSALKVAMRCGETVIITSADESWVLRSARRFTPRVGPLVQQLYDDGRIISARRRYEASFPGDVFAWKREAFREVVDLKLGAGRARSTGGLNLVVLGDSPAEIEAAQTSTLGVSPLLVKTVKFKVAPTAEEIVEQLRMVCQDLPSIVADDKNVARSLATSLRSVASRQHAAHSFGAQTAYVGTPPLWPYSAVCEAGQVTTHVGPQGNCRDGDDEHNPRLIYAACR